MRRILVSLILLATTACGTASSTGYSEATAISRVENMSTGDLDSSTPSEPFGTWLRRTLRTQSIAWGVQVGCGDPQNSRPSDVCVSAIVPVPDEFEVGIVILVGDEKHLRERPSLDLLFFDKTDLTGYQELADLSELEHFMKNRSEP